MSVGEIIVLAFVIFYVLVAILLVVCTPKEITIARFVKTTKELKDDTEHR